MQKYRLVPLIAYVLTFYRPYIGHTSAILGSLVKFPCFAYISHLHSIKIGHMSGDEVFISSDVMETCNAKYMDRRSQDLAIQIYGLC